MTTGQAAAQAGVDANTATQAELGVIDGIGPALAARIVDERRKAPFRSLEDFQSRVRGVGPNTLRKMRDSGLVVGARRANGAPETIVGGARPVLPARQTPRAAVK